MKLNDYLQELFGLFAPSGDEISDPIINKMNSELVKIGKLCNNIKEENEKQICINEKILKLKKDIRRELIQGISKCEGKRPCHKIIVLHASKLDYDISNLEKQILQLKRKK